MLKLKVISGLCVFSLVHSAFAAKVIPLNLVDLVAESNQIFEARCVAIDHGSVKSAGGKTDIPVVRYTFELIDNLKGNETPTVVVAQLGKFQDGRRFFVDPDHIGIPRYEVGGHYLLFIDTPGVTGLATPCGLAQGVFDVHAGRVENRAGNRYILTGMEASLAQTRYAALLKERPNRVQRKTSNLILFKALIQDILAGRIQAPSRKEKQL